MKAWIDGVFANDKSMGFIIGWGEVGFGFGQLTIQQLSADDNIVVETECMGKEYTKKILIALLDSLEEDKL